MNEKVSQIYKYDGSNIVPKVDELYKLHFLFLRGGNVITICQTPLLGIKTIMRWKDYGEGFRALLKIKHLQQSASGQATLSSSAIQNSKIPLFRVCVCLARSRSGRNKDGSSRGIGAKSFCIRIEAKAVKWNKKEAVPYEVQPNATIISIHSHAKFYNKKISNLEVTSEIGKEERKIVKITKYRYVCTYSQLHVIKKQTVRRSSICLLYTSPSPRDKRQSRMPSSA